MDHNESPSEDKGTSSCEIERIITRELEPLRDEVARLRAHVAALRDAFVPW
jgi:hypothetical protein